MVDREEDSSKQPKLEELISLSDAAKISGLSPSHLRLLVSRGDIWGVKIGRNWVTTKLAVDQYLVQDNKPGPKLKKTPD